MCNCSKCGNRGTILLRKKDFYCKDCFITNVNHKFRASIGKTKIVSPNANVLICLSGGLGSTVLLDLIKNGIYLDNHKRLRITPIFFHAIGSGDTNCNITVANEIIKQCNNGNFNIHLCNISQYTKSIKTDSKVNEIPDSGNKENLQLETLLGSMQQTSQNDYLNKIKREIFISYAKELNCSYIFTAETMSRLAVNLLSNLTLGRGSQVQHEIGFCDTRNDVKIIRPMKDISYEELQNYIKIRQLMSAKMKVVQENSLQCVIQTFVNNLQDNFPSTISTVCKTADKIGLQNNNDKSKKCMFCESVIGERNSQLSALEATNYSRTLSVSHINTNPAVSVIDKQSLLMFPHVDKYFCYACSKNYQEMDQSAVPNHIKDLILSNK